MTLKEAYDKGFKDGVFQGQSYTFYSVEFSLSDCPYYNPPVDESRRSTGAEVLDLLNTGQ